MTSDNARQQGVQVHETAVIDDGARIGSGTKIWHWVHVCANAVIGQNCSFGQNVFVGNRVTIGNNVRVQNNVSIYDDVYLEDDVFCGPSMVFTNVINPRAHVSRKSEYKVTRVARGASIGANATIVCGNTIGQYAFVGAGAVVSNDVAPYALVVGVPARQIGWVCQCGVRLDYPRSTNNSVIICPSCDRRFAITTTACTPVNDEP